MRPDARRGRRLALAVGVAVALASGVALATQVRIQPLYDAVGGAGRASKIEIRLVDAQGREIRATRTTDGAPVTTTYSATLAAGAAPLVLDLVPQTRIAHRVGTDTAAPTWYRVRRSADGIAPASELIQVPDSATVQELATLIGATAITPGEVLAGRLLPVTTGAAAGWGITLNSALLPIWSATGGGSGCATLACLLDGPSVLGSAGQALVVAAGGTAWEWASVVGTPGPTGPQGPAGADGAAGAAGATGPTGPQGPAGADGAAGTAGATGPTGPQGPAGADGAAGAAGATGPTGPQGLAGADGAAGTAGATGPTGPAGPSTPSAQAGNLLTTGTDSLLYTSATQITPSAIGAAAASHTQAWSTITTTPTTLAGYGITDAEPAGGSAALRYEWIEWALTSPGATLIAATTFYADLPYTATATRFRVTCQTAPTTSAAVIDLKRNAAWGSAPASILSATLSLAAGSYEAATTSFGTASLTIDDVLAVSVTSIDSGATAAGCIATLALTRAAP